MKPWLLVGALACSKAVVPAPLAGAPEVGVALVVLGEAGPAGPDLPEMRRMVADQLARDGVTARPLGELAAVVAASSTADRVRAAASASQGAQWVLLVESKPGFVSQVAGQYRWQVDTVLSLAPVEAPERVRSWEREIPVYLRFYHEQEVAAVEGSAVRLERHLARALEEAGVVGP